MRSSTHFTGLPVSTEAATAITYPGYTGTLPPNPPPISGEMMRILCSSNPTWPATSAKTVRMACGAWVVIQTVSLPSTLSKCAMQPQVSIEAT